MVAWEGTEGAATYPYGSGGTDESEDEDDQCAARVGDAAREALKEAALLRAKADELVRNAKAARYTLLEAPLALQL